MAFLRLVSPHHVFFLSARHVADFGLAKQTDSSTIIHHSRAGAMFTLSSSLFYPFFIFVPPAIALSSLILQCLSALCGALSFKT
jgi:hypothetical protein